MSSRATSIAMTSPLLPTSMPRTPVVSRPIDARVGLGEADRQAGLRDHDDLVVRVDRAHGEQLVVVADVDRDDPVGFDRRVVGEELRLLDRAALRREDEVLRLGEVARGDAPPGSARLRAAAGC